MTLKPPIDSRRYNLKSLRLTIVALNLHFLGDSIVNLLVLLLAASQAELALGSSGSTPNITSKLFGGFLWCSGSSEEEVSRTKSSGSDTSEGVRRDSRAGL